MEISVPAQKPLSPIGQARHLFIPVGTAICATVAIWLFLDMSAQSTPAADDSQISNGLATMLRAARTVISKNQDRINDASIGDKGLDAKKVLGETIAIYRQSSEVDPGAIDTDSLQGRLIHMQMESIAEVMEVHQETINRQGVGFKGFIPAVFARLVNEAFGRRAAGVAEIKVTAPPQLLRNPKVQPDPWELEVIQSQLLSPSWQKNQPYSAIVEKNGKQAQRTLMPEYYGRSCLACHGDPQGEIDITGFPKEGAHEGDLGGIISITLYR